jgi:hypothetical protein
MRQEWECKRMVGQLHGSDLNQLWSSWIAFAHLMPLGEASNATNRGLLTKMALAE